MARPAGTKNIESPERLWEYFKAYVQHERDNPMVRTDYVGKDGEEKKTRLETPITFEGFECYLADQGVIQNLSHYSADTDNAYSDYRTIITRIRNNCFVHNFKGAAVGLFNANLIARKLGISDKQDQTVEVKTFDVSLKL